MDLITASIIGAVGAIVAAIILSRDKDTDSKTDEFPKITNEQRWKIASTENKLGKHFEKHSDHEKALAHFLNAEKQYKIINTNGDMRAWNLWAAAVQHGKLNQDTLALDCYASALVILEGHIIKNRRAIAKLYENIAIVYGRQKKFEKAFSLYIKAYRFYCKKFSDQHPDVVRCRKNMEIDYKAAGRTQPFDQWLAQQLKTQTTTKK